MAEGIYVPMFLAANITERSNHQGVDSYLMRMHSNAYVNLREERYLSAADWDDVFFDAEQLGIRIIFIRGGEPLTRKCILERASRYPGIFFPVITNGSMMDEQYLDFFRQNRNLIPMLSMADSAELDVSQTGKASFAYGKTMQTMEELHGRGLIFGVVENLTRENYRRMLSSAYLSELRRKGSSIVLYAAEAGENAGTLLEEKELEEIELLAEKAQEENQGMIVAALPVTGIAMGRNIFQREGLFEITPVGVVQPAIHRTDGTRNVRESSLTEILKDDLYWIQKRA
ncbi:MAG: radical SAM protein [Candidatus Limivivens sp.]|nr:radical SAM protein [Candidatus Limivivens sp.]